MKKVLLIIRWPVGGIRTYINYIYASWEGMPLELHILTPDVPEVAYLKASLSGKNCHWYTTRSEVPGVFSFAIAARRVLAKYDFDLVHTHGFTSALATAWWLTFKRTRSLFTSHDVLLDRQFTGWRGSLKRLVLTWSLNRYEVIHSVSNDADKNLKQFLPGLRFDRCRVIPNAIDTERFFRAPPEYLQDIHGLQVNSTLIGYFGRFMEQKGFNDLVAAIEILNTKNLPSFHVVCFGSGGYIREEQLILKKKGLQDQFHFHPLVADIAPYIKGCDLVVMPSRWEACGLLAMEALTSGIRLVATRCIGLREVCEQTPAIMVDVASPPSLADGIIRARETPRADFEVYASVARERFSIVSTRREIESLYFELMSH